MRFEFAQFYQQLFGSLASLGVSDVEQSVTTTLILTPNERLATVLTEAYGQWCGQQGRQEFLLPQFSSLSNWLLQLWQLQQIYSNPACSNELILSQAQEGLFWQQVIEKTSELSLLDMKGLVASAQEAYKLLRNARIPIKQIKALAVGEQALFVQWLEALQSYCQQHGYVCVADLPQRLLALSDFSGFVWQRWVWVGFMELSPQEVMLKEHIANVTGIKTLDYQFETKNHTVLRASFADHEQELRAAVCWLKQKKEYKQNVEGSAQYQSSYALVVPQLDQNRAFVRRIFREEWASQNLVDIDDDSIDHEISFSGGDRLIQAPLIQSAACILSFMQTRYTREHLKILLISSSIIGYRQERWQRYQVYRALTKVQVDAFVTSDLSNSLRAVLPFSLQKLCPQFFMCLKRAQKWHIKMQYDKHQDWQHWVETLLQIWEWPGEQTLSSIEFQQVQKFKESLGQWLTLRGVSLYDLSLGRAYDLLIDVLSKTLFQAQSKGSTVQVLGVLEALGQPFDAIWVLGVHSDDWPKPVLLNPLLPIVLQQRYKTQRATAQKELALAQSILNIFSNSAAEVVFSWPKRDERQEFSGSNLLEGVAWMSTSQQATLLADSPLLFHTQAARLETIDQSYGPAYKIHTEAQAQTKNERVLLGGAGLIKAFAECPFKAFSRYRLRLSAANRPLLGLNAADRGDTVHKSLQLFWQQCQNQEQLKDMSDAQLKQAIAASVSEALKNNQAYQKLCLQPLILKAESARLEHLLNVWVQLEKTRSYFKVKYIEHEVLLKVHNVPLRLRMDRVDELADGTLLVIDYKTGLVSLNECFGERLQSPQLPLYCIAFAPTAKGVYFALVRKKNPIFKGLEDTGVSFYENPEPGVDNHLKSQEDWQVIVQQWQSDIEAAMVDFLAGLAVVDPIAGQSTCRNCDFGALCRIRERAIS